MTEKACTGCGALFRMQSYDWPKNFAKRQFCSVQCRAKHGPKRKKRPPQHKICAACGSRFERGKIGQARWDARSYCSSGCSSRGKPRDNYWNVTHGQSRDPIYNIWTAMKQRCLNPRHPQWHRYGGRGISICKRWVESVEAFAADMGPRPPGGTLERENNDRGYEPGNCIWAPRSAQSNNISTNRIITIGGVSRSVRQWEQHMGCARGTISSRLNVLGWSERDAVLVPAVRGQKHQRRVRHEQ